MEIQLSTLFSTYLLTSLFACLPLSLHASEKEAPYSWKTFGYEQLLKPEFFFDILEEQNTLEGLTRSTGGITVENYKNIICSQQISITPGGVFDAASVTIQNIQNDIKFISNITTQKGGVIHTPGNCTITQNLGKQYYISNESNASASTANSSYYGGVVYCRGDFELSKNRATICFAYNVARQRGGAIASETYCKIRENTHPILFTNNLALKEQGGAIYCRDCEIANNSGPICITSNCSPIGGGCLATSSVAIKNNSNLILFSNNSGVCDQPVGATSSGGAISAPMINIENNSGPICFDNNIVDRNGGALWFSTLTIKNNGLVQFINNRSKWGGALLIKNNGSCELSADNGDIIFDSNCGIKSDQLYRNAMHCTAGTTLKIGAKKNRCVKFYDPIQCTYSSPLIAFNHEDYHQGTILFSSVFVPPSFKLNDNFMSYIRNPLTIHNGVLAIEDRAALAAYQITQTEGTLRLGNGAVITTIQNASPQTTDGCTLALSKLALNLPSILAKGAEAPKIWVYPAGSNNNYTEDPNPTITISGPLKLLDNYNDDPYDSLNLSHGITRVPFLYLCDNATKKINIDALNVEAINDHLHYGYQGVWSPYWEEYTTITNPTSVLTANTSHRLLYADWTPTGYIPNPKYKTPLIANALWGSVYTTLSGMRTLPSPVANPDHFELSSQGVLLGVRQHNRSGIRGFRMESSGYALTSSAATKIDRKISFAFSQQMSHIKEHTTSNKVSSKNFFGSVQLRLPWLTASLAYNYGDHTAKHFYTEDNKDSEGNFHSHTFGACLNFTLNRSPINNAFIAPFIEAVAFRAMLSGFTEQGDFARKFTMHKHLQNLALPVGMIVQWAYDGHLPTTWQIQLAYHPVIYRHYPKVATTLLASSGTWHSSGTPIARNAFSFKIGNETQILSYVNIFLNYQGEGSSSFFSHYLKAGSTLTF